MKKLIQWIIAVLTPLAYEAVKLDSINKKMIEAIPGLPGYYRFVNFADMPQSRFVHYLYLVKRLSMNVDEDLLNTYLKAFEEAFKKGEADKFNAAMFMLKDTMKTVTPVETYYWMAALCYFDINEDLAAFDYDYNLKKVNFFKGLPNQTFFLASVLKHLHPSGSASLKDTETYLKEAQVKSSQYGRILGEMTSPV